MKRKSQTIKQAKQDNPSFFVVEQKEREDTFTEITMSDIAKKLRSVYAQMQRKHLPRPLVSQSSVEAHFKSYLDDISRAILAEYYVRCQREKKLFEHLGEIKSLVQNLQNEKRNLEGAVIKQHMSRSKSLDSVVQKLADMTCEEKQERLLLQEALNFSGQECTTQGQKNVKNLLQKENKSSLPTDLIKPSFKETEKLVGHSEIEERCSYVQEFGRSNENELSLSLKTESQSRFSLLRYLVKKVFLCFLIIVFMAATTICFYSFLRGALFHFMI